jgi:hypothetical protein
MVLAGWTLIHALVVGHDCVSPWSCLVSYDPANQPVPE